MPALAAAPIYLDHNATTPIDPAVLEAGAGRRPGRHTVVTSATEHPSVLRTCAARGRVGGS